MNYNYPGELGKEIFKAMSNTKSTELDKDFEYKNRYSGGAFNHFHVLIICIVSGLGLLAIFLTAIFGEVIDSVSPEVQLLILLGACLTFSSIRGYLWIRKSF